MATIRSIVRNNHSLITHRRLGVAQAQEMSYQIKQEIENIQAQESDTKLALKLEPILQKINEGVEAVAAPSESLSRIDGLFQIDSALTDYGTAIDDPKWQGLRTQ